MKNRRASLQADTTIQRRLVGAFGINTLSRAKACALIHWVMAVHTGINNVALSHVSF